MSRSDFIKTLRVQRLLTVHNRNVIRKQATSKCSSVFIYFMDLKKRKKRTESLLAPISPLPSPLLSVTVFHRLPQLFSRSSENMQNCTTLQWFSVNFLFFPSIDKRIDEQKFLFYSLPLDKKFIFFPPAFTRLILRLNGLTLKGFSKAITPSPTVRKCHHVHVIGENFCTKQ